MSSLPSGKPVSSTSLNAALQSFQPNLALQYSAVSHISSLKTSNSLSGFLAANFLRFVNVILLSRIFVQLQIILKKFLPLFFLVKFSCISRKSSTSRLLQSFLLNFPSFLVTVQLVSLFSLTINSLLISNPRCRDLCRLGRTSRKENQTFSTLPVPKK